MENKKRTLLIIVIVAILIVGAIAYMVIQDIKQEDKLIEELRKIESTNLKTGTIDMNIKTKGDYAVVEKTAKTVFSDFLTLYQETIQILESKQITNILTVDNYIKDGPTFTESKKAILTMKEKLNQNLTKMMEFTKESYIMGAIEAKKIDDYYVRFYKDVMIDEVSAKDFKRAQEELQEAKKIMDQLFAVETKILDFLSEHPDAWKVSDQVIVFNNEELLNTYNDFIAELPK